MRVTTKMLNDSMTKAGLIMDGGLLGKVNNRKKDDGGLLEALQKREPKTDDIEKIKKIGAGRYANADSVVSNYTAKGRLAAYLAAGRYDFWG